MKTKLRIILATIAFLTLGIIANAQVAHRSQNSAQTSSTTLTITKPSGLALGDMMIAVINQSDNDNSSLSDATRTGWTKISGGKFYESGPGGSADEWWGTVLYKVADASDVAATNFAFTIDNDQDGGVGGIMAFSGVHATNPFDVVSSSTLTQGNGSLSASGITTVTDGSMIVFAGFVANDAAISSWAATSPSPLTESFDNAFNANLDLGVGAAYGLKASRGATGNASATVSERTGGVLIALRPAAPLPTVSSFSPSPICVGSQLTITGTNFNVSTATASVGGTALTNVTVVSATQITATVPAGATSGTVSVSTNIGTGISSGTLTVNALPSAGTLSGTQTVCVNANTTFTSTQSSGSWSSSNTAIASIDASTGVITGIAAGTATMTYTYSNGTCSGTNTRTVTVNAIPTPTFTAPAAAASLPSNTQTTYTTQAGQTSYVWSIPGVAGTDYTLVSGGNSTSSSAVITWLTTGSKTVTVSYTSSAGCVAATPATVTNDIYFESNKRYAVASGNWNSTATWSTTSGGASGASVPGAGMEVYVENGFTVALNANSASLSLLNIAAGGRLNASGTNTMSATTITVNGYYNNGSTGAITGTITVGAGATYDHALNGGNVPTATWQDNSTCLITGITTTDPGGLNGQSFWNLTYNNTNQTDIENIDQSFTVRNNFYILSTGSGQLKLANSGSTPQTVSTKNFQLSGNSTFMLSSNTAVGTLNVSGDFTFTSGTLTEDDAGSGLVNFNGVSTQTFTSGGTVSNSINFVVKSGAYLQMASATSAITGGGAFTIESDGKLGIKSTSGITATGGGAVGHVQVSGTRTFNAAADYLYNGDAAQSTGNAIAAGADSLQIQNNAGVTLSNAFTGPVALVELLAGDFTLGGANLIPDATPISMKGGNLKTGASAGNSETAGILDVDVNGAINLGTGSHSLTFAASNGQAWDASTLTINGWTGDAGVTGTGGKIFFGSNNTGLTSAQLSKITFTGYPGTPILLSTGELVPQAIPTIIATGNPVAMNTIYGTASNAATFSLSSVNLSAGILVTPPSGFEVSTSETTGYASSITVGTGGDIAATTIYIRLAASTVPGTYSGNVVLTSAGATSQNVALQNSVVSKIALTIANLSGVSKVYDGTVAATYAGDPVLIGIVGADDVTLDATNASAAFLTATAANGKQISGSGFAIAGAQAAYYSLTQPTLFANITKKGLTITGAQAANKPYDGNAVASISGTLDGVVASDVNNVSFNGVGTFASAAAGTGIAVTSGITLSGTAANNYTLTQPVSLAADITKVALTITGISISNKEYDGTDAATITGTPAYSGLIASEVATFASVTGTAAANFADANAGNGKSVAVSGYTAPSNNYSISQPAGLTANITPKSISVTGLTAPDKIYDASTSVNVTGTPEYSGLVAGETFSITGSISYAFADATVGVAKTINATGLNAPSANYTINQPIMTANIVGVYNYIGAPEQPRNINSLNLLNTSLAQPSVPSSASTYTENGVRYLELVIKGGVVAIDQIVADINPDDQLDLTAGDVALSASDYSLITVTAGSVYRLKINATQLRNAATIYNMYLKLNNFATPLYFSLQAAALPVHLTSFTAKVTPDNKVSLGWVTGSESQNRGFRIERQSQNGKFEQIGFVASKAQGGNSAMSLYYSFIDQSPLNGTSFYRLVQEDLDGKKAPSEVRVIKMNGQSVAMAYPNPTTGNFTISRTNDGRKMNIQVYDMSGRMVKQINQVTETNYKMTINQAGVYSIKLIYPETGEQSIQRIVVQK